MGKQKLALNTFCLGLGFAMGVIVAQWMTSRRASVTSPIAQLPAWERALAKRYGIRKAALLAAQVQIRYEELFTDHPRFRNAALRKHLESNILPGIALYQVLREALQDPAEALSVLDNCFTAHVHASRMGQQAWILDCLPGGFTILRLANRMVLQSSFPKEGWQIEWVEDNPQRIAYNITGCFYLNILNTYGVPELTAHFCAGDDLLYGSLKTIAWERTETLGRGDPRCNFGFRPRSVQPEILLTEIEDA